MDDRIFVVYVDWKIKEFHAEIVGVFLNEDTARKAKNDKIDELEDEGYVLEDDFVVWFEDTFFRL